MALGLLSIGMPAAAFERYQALHDAAEQLYRDLVNRTGSGDAAESMIADAQEAVGLTQPAQPLPVQAPVALEEGSIVLLDLRIALAQLAVLAGTNDQLSVVRAQSAEKPQVIAIQDGLVDLAAVRQWIEARPDSDQLITADVLRVPLVVLGGGALRMNPGDKIALSRADGAFLANFGMLMVDRASISGTTEANAQVPTFAPFVTTVGSGAFQATGADLSRLGFGETALFAGVSVTNSGIYPALRRSMVTGTILKETGGLTLTGTQGAVVQGNVIHAPEGRALTLNGATQTHVIANIFLDGSARISNRSDGTALAQNILLGADEAGITVNNASRNTVLRENFIWRSATNGISVADSDCTLINQNTLIGNDQKGMVLRTSRRSEVSDNAIIGNRSDGLMISNQPQDTETAVIDNLFAANRIGLSSRSASTLRLVGNDFSQQFPRFLGGDITVQTGQIVNDLVGVHEISINAGTVESFRAPAEDCLWERGE